MIRAFALILLAGPVVADPVDILEVTARETGGTWRFAVRVNHPDTGWDHYADGWRIEDAAGNVLGLRVLAHPHVNEMPFTRALNGVVIPAELKTVYLRARCLVDGWNAETTAVTLP